VYTKNLSSLLNVVGVLKRCCCLGQFVLWRGFLSLLGDGSLSLLANEGLVDVGNDSTSGNGGLDECVQLLVSSDGQLQVTGGDTLHLQILGGVTCQLQNLSGQVLQDGSRVDGGGGSHTSVRGGPVLEVTVDPAHWELEAGPS